MVNHMYTITAILSLVINCIILNRTVSIQNTENENKDFILLLKILSVFFIVDALWGLLASLPKTIQFPMYVFTYGFHLAAGGISLCWLFFTFRYLGKETKQYIGFIIFGSISIGIEVLLLLINVFTKKLFCINTNGTYIFSNLRHFIFLPQFLIYLILSVYISALTISEKDLLAKSKLFSIFIFNLIPMIFGLLQISSPYMPFYSLGFMLSCIILFSFNVTKENKQYIINASAVKELSRIKQEKTLHKCLTILYENKSTENTILEMLEVIGEFYSCHSAFIFEINRNRTYFKNVFKWSRNPDTEDRLDGINTEEIIPWVTGTRDVLITNIEKELDHDSDVYKAFKAFNIHNFFADGFWIDNDIQGFLGIENFDFNQNELEVIRLLSPLVYCELLRRHKNDEEAKIIDSMIDSYISVFFVDFEADYYRTFSTSERFRERFNPNSSYYKTMNSYIDHSVDPNNKEYVRLMTNSAFAMDQLKQKESYSVKFIDNSSSDRRDFEFKFVRANEKGTCAVLFCKDRTEEVREDLLEQMNKKQNSEIIEILASEYTSLYYVDLVTGKYVVYSLSDRVAENTRKLIDETPDFYDLYRKFIDQSVHPDYQSGMLEYLSYEKIKMHLKNRKSFSKMFLSNHNGDFLYMEMYWVKVDDVNESPNAVVIGFTEKDKEYRSKIATEKEKERNFEIINILASEYSSVYYINLSDGELTPYSMNEATENLYGNIFRNGIHYEEAFSMFVKDMIYEHDQEMLLHAGSIENIKKELRNKKTFTTIYRSNDFSGPRYCEMRFVKVNDESEKPTAVALAFADKDQEIIGRYINKQLVKEYDSVYFADLENNTIHIYKPTDKEFFNNVASGAYNVMLKKLSQSVSKEFRKTWETLSIPAEVQKFLAEEDTRELVFNIPELGKTSTRSYWQVVERRNGIPVTIIISFLDIDAATSEKMLLDKKIAQQKNELEEKQQLLEQALENAKAASKAKTSFLSNMSHDIRTPMNAIIGYTTLARQNIGNQEKIKTYLENTATSSQHLLSLINDILDMSRIESGKLQIEETKCSLSEIMHSLNTIILGQIQAKQLNYHNQNQNITDEFVYCDQLRINQLLINLLSNAVKFTQVGGEIRVLVKQTARTDKTGDYEFHVKDNGIGMNPEFVKKIFEPFERERTSTISKTQGTGLGMSITKSIVDMMDGTIDIISEPGKGSEFIVKVTLKLSDENERDFKIPLLENKNALVFDTESSVCENICTQMNRIGLNAQWVTSPQEIVLRAENAQKAGMPFSVYIIENLPGDFTILELVKQIRQMDEKAFIILNSYDNILITEEAKTAGVNDFIAKPVFLSNLYDTLCEVTGLKTESQETKSDDDFDFTGKKILLAEDNELNREIAKELLEDKGFIVDATEDGLVTYEKLMNSKPGTYDLILMDIQMPVMDGYEATVKIRSLENKQLANIPIVAMTANAFEEDRKTALEIGMNEHISKPISIEELIRILKKVVK